MGLIGIEPITYRLSSNHSTIELQTLYMLIYNREDQIRTDDDRVKVGCLTTWLRPSIYYKN